MIEREGFEDVERKLAGLSSGVNRILGAGLRAEMKVIAAGIAAAAPRGEDRVVRHSEIRGGGLGHSIGQRQKKSRGAIVEAKVGIGVAKTQVGYGTQVSKGSSAVPYGHLVAKGTSERWTGERTSKGRKGRIYRKKTGNAVMYRGRVKPNDFVERGFRATQGAAEAAGIAKIEEGIRKEIAKG